MKVHTPLVALLLSLPVLSTQGMASSYSFGTGCTSVGGWTNVALAQTNSIRGIIEQLKDNPACAIAAKSMADDINAAEAEIRKLKEANADPASDDLTRAFRLPQEIRALQNMTHGPDSLRGDVSRLLIDRAVEAAAVTSGAAATTLGTSAAEALSNPQTAMDAVSKLKSLISRAKSTTTQATGSIKAVFEKLPIIERCLVGKQDRLGSDLLSNSIRLAATFVGAGDVVMSNMTDVMRSFARYVRETKFANALRDLDQAEFWNSMSCLIESTQQTFCTAQEARSSLQLYLDNQQFYHDVKTGVDSSGQKITNPLQGFFLLIQHLPVINQWVQRVMFSTDPNYTLEAQFQNQILQNMHGYIVTKKTIAGLVGDYVVATQGLGDDGKRNALLNLIMSVTQTMVNGTRERETVNFYDRAKTTEQLPYYLIGLETIPQSAISQVGGYLPFRDWAQGAIAGKRFVAPKPGAPPVDTDGDGETDGIKWVSEFKEPNATFENIFKVQLKKLNEKSDVDSSNYFANQLIADKGLIVLQALTGPVRSVFESFSAVKVYLENILVRVNSGELASPGKKDQKLLGKFAVAPIIVDTISQIQIIMDQFTAIQGVAEQYEQQMGSIENMSKMTEADKRKMLEDIKRAYENVISIVYEHLNIRLQRDTFLGNRLYNLVKYDYSMRLRAKQFDQMDPYQESLLLAANFSILEVFFGIIGPDSAPAEVKTDLDAAQSVNRENIRALEAFFTDPLLNALRALKLTVDGKKPTNTDYNLATTQDYIRDKTGGLIEHKDDGIIMKMERGFLNLRTWIGLPAKPLLSLQNQDRYQMRSGRDNGGYLDDKYKSISQYKTKLCIQSLSFSNDARKSFDHYCQGVVLKSPFSKGDETKIEELDLPYDYLEKATPRDPGEKDITADPLKGKSFYSNAICGVRDYFRANRVKFMIDELGKREEKK